MPKELVAMVASHKSSIIVCYYEGDSLIKRFAFSANFKIFFCRHHLLCKRNVMTTIEHLSLLSGSQASAWPPSVWHLSNVASFALLSSLSLQFINIFLNAGTA